MDYIHHGMAMIYAKDPLLPDLSHHANGIVAAQFSHSMPWLVSILGTPEELISLGAELINLATRELREKEGTA